MKLSSLKKQEASCAPTLETSKIGFYNPSTVAFSNTLPQGEQSQSCIIPNKSPWEIHPLDKRKISRRYAIEAKCHDCQGAYIDGKHDCEIVMCSLYPFMPYRKRKPVLDWQQYSPRRVGHVTLDEINSQEVLKNTPEIPVNGLGGSTHTETDHGHESPEKTTFTAQESETRT